MPAYIEATGKSGFREVNARATARDKSLGLLAKANNMNTKLMISVAAAALIGLGGCSTSPTNAQIGTGVGAVAGGLVGNAVFGSTLGTVGGAAAGAVIGNEIGKKR
jgi:osmotically inducible lipoprotein OsmB